MYGVQKPPAAMKCKPYLMFGYSDQFNVLLHDASHKWSKWGSMADTWPFSRYYGTRSWIVAGCNVLCIPQLKKPRDNAVIRNSALLFLATALKGNSGALSRPEFWIAAMEVLYLKLFKFSIPQSTRKPKIPITIPISKAISHRQNSASLHISKDEEIMLHLAVNIQATFAWNHFCLFEQVRSCHEFRVLQPLILKCAGWCQSRCSILVSVKIVDMQSGQRTKIFFLHSVLWSGA